MERQHAQSDLNAVTGVFQVASATVLGLPNHPIDPAKLPMPIELGVLTAVIESYPGHSGTDMIVRVPEQNVVYTGDLLFHGWYPVCFDEKATISGWRDTLKKFAAFDKDTLFVPGHGQICGQDGIASIREVFDDIAGQAEKMYKAGVPAEEAQHRYAVPDKFKNFPIFAWARPRKPSTATQCRTSSRTSRFLPGDSPSAPRSPNCMRSGKESSRSGDHGTASYSGRMQSKLWMVSPWPGGEVSPALRSHRIACIPTECAASISFAASEMNKNWRGAYENEATIFS